MEATGVRQSEDVWDVAPEDFPGDGDREEQARFLLRYAILAPSRYNAQPWAFVVRGDEIRVHEDRDRWREVGDAGARELHLGLGCALENLVVAARRFGCAPRVTYHRDVTPSCERLRGPTVATVRLRRDGAVDDAPADTSLFDAITERRTNRGRFTGAGLDRADRGALWAAAARPDPDADEPDPPTAADGDSVIDVDPALHVVEDPDAIAAIASMQRRADARRFGDPDYREELGHLIWSGALDAAWLADRIAALVVTHLGLGDRRSRKHAELLESTGAVGLVTTATDGVVPRLEAGRAVERCWLRATARGLAVHPMNRILEVPALREELARVFAVVNRTAQLLCRVGCAEHGAARRPRRPLVDVLDDEPLEEELERELEAIETAHARDVCDERLGRIAERLEH